MFKRPWFWVITLVVVIGAVLTATTVIPVKNFVFGRPECSPSAIRQLPKRVVDIVNAQQEQHRIFDSKDLAVRELDANWESVAHVTFMPGYCGFVGNVTQQPVTEEARAGKVGYTSEAVRNDVVKLVRNGQPFQRSGNDICISNTVPTVNAGTSLQMTLSCDRLYEEGTWATPTPQLVEIG